jgi:hypothetical protein
MTPPSRFTGRCLCGSVTYTVEAEPVAQAVCHCTDCQRQTGGPYSVIVGVPRAALSVEGETLSSYTTIGEDHGAETERSFCEACGTPVFSHAAAMPEVVFVKAGSLDDASWVQPAIEVWTRSAQPWTPAFEETARLQRGPGSDAASG